MKKRYAALACCFVLFTFTAFAQAPDWQWAKDGQGDNYDQGYDVAVDASGNSYVTGVFASTSLTFGSTTLTNTGTVPNVSTYDIFLLKYNPSGSLLWAVHPTGSSDDLAYSVAVDAAGNSYLTGSFYGPTITFGTTVLNNSEINNSADIFLVKFDPAGNVIRATSFGGTQWDFASAIQIDGAGNSYVAGYFSSPSITFGTSTVTNSSSDFDIFVAKFDPSGNPLWVTGATGTGYESLSSITIDAAGNSYVCGYLSATASLTVGTTTLVGWPTNSSFFIKLDSSGNPVWAQALTATDVYTVTTDASGNLYVAGWFSDPNFVFGPVTLTNSSAPSTEIFLAKLDPAGNVIWVKSAAGSGYDYIYSLAIDAAGNCIASGTYSNGTITFGSFTLNNSFPMERDMFLVGYDPSGNELWLKGTGGAGRDDALGIALDGADDIYVTGFFGGPHADFAPADTLFHHDSFPSDIGDFFIAKTGAGKNGINAVGFSDGNITLYPNPSAGIFYLDIPLAANLPGAVTIYNSLGQLVHQSAITGTRSVIDLSGNAEGIYYWSVLQAGKICASGKLSVQ